MPTSVVIRCREQNLIGFYSHGYTSPYQVLADLSCDRRYGRQHDDLTAENYAFELIGRKSPSGGYGFYLLPPTDAHAHMDAVITLTFPVTDSTQRVSDLETVRVTFEGLRGLYLGQSAAGTLADVYSIGSDAFDNACAIDEKEERRPVMSNEKNLRNDEEQIDEDDAKIIAALEAAVAEAHNGKPSMTKEERRIRMFKSDLDEAAELLRKAHVTLSAFTASETPQECIIPREAASEFCRSLSQQGVPHLLYEFDPFEPSDYVPETDLTEAMDYIAEHVGCSFFEERIKPAIVCMHFTRESVIEYCEDYNRPKPRDPFWKALRWFEMDLLQYEGEVVKETNNPWYEMPPFKK